MSKPPLLRGLRSGVLAFIVLAATGCSVRQYAVNRLGDALAQSSGGTFASDDDPDLVKAAAPFSLKLVESLLAESPNHPALLLSAASGFTEYAYAFVQPEADELETTDFSAAQAAHGRAKRLYLRARNYGLRGLDVRHPGFGAALGTDPAQAAARADQSDVPLLYWTAAAWSAAIAQAKDEPALIADLPKVEALIASASLLSILHQPAAAIGALFVIRMLAPFVVSPVAGVLADRYNRK